MADLNVTVYTSPYGIVGAKGADGVLSSSGVITYNGFTGDVQGVSSWNGKTGALQGVCTWNGLTGALQGVCTWNGFTGALQGVCTWNGFTGALQGVCTWNGLTGDVTGVTTGVANNFKALQSFSNGISASGGITFNGILNIGQMLSYGGTDNIKIGELVDSTVEIGNLSNLAFLSVEGDSESIILTTNQFLVTATDVAFNNSNITGKLVTSLNGKTGALKGVCAINGLTGTVGLSAGININIATVGNTLTVATTSNVAKTDTAQTFTELQQFTNGFSASAENSYIALYADTPPASNAVGTSGNLIFVYEGGILYLYYCVQSGLWRRFTASSY